MACIVSHFVEFQFKKKKKKDKLFVLKATNEDIPSNQLKIPRKKNNMTNCKYTVWNSKVSKKVEY